MFFARFTLGQNLPCRGATTLFKLGRSAVGDYHRHYSGFMLSHGLTSRRLLGSAFPSAGVRSNSGRFLWSSHRLFRTAQASRGVDTASTLDSQLREEDKPFSYRGPLTQTFRRLKIFSLASLGLTFTMTPFLFIVESSLPTSARIFLTATALSTSSISTALIGWCGAPYVVDLRRLIPAENEGIEGVEMTTLTLTLKKLTTRVYDADFLVETRRPFAKWELPLSVQLPRPDEDIVSAGKAGVPGQEETVAETFNSKGEVIGHWIVRWGQGGTGACRGSGKILRYFNVHEELL